MKNKIPKLDYNCTLAKFAEQLDIKLWQAMQMMKYAEHKQDSIIKNLRSGVKILRGHNNSIIYNNINNNYEGILVSRSSNNLIYGNNIADNSGNGVIFIEGSTNNSISNNTISKNLVGIMLKNSGFNHIKHNNLIDNIQENLKIIK